MFFTGTAAWMAVLSAPGLAVECVSWLAAINFVRAVFNTLPAAPLDGGRVLRAYLWHRGEDPVRAARGAATAGRYLGWFMLLPGFASVLLSGVLVGQWAALVGWFLIAAGTFAVFVRDHDQPVVAGGDDDGPTPVELFVSSLAACVAYYAGRFLQRHQLPCEGLRVRAEFDMADDRPARVAAVRMRILLPVPLSQVRRRALCAVVNHCTVHNSLRRPPEITVVAD